MCVSVCLSVCLCVCALIWPQQEIRDRIESCIYLSVCLCLGGFTLYIFFPCVIQSCPPPPPPRRYSPSLWRVKSQQQMRLKEWQRNYGRSMGRKRMEPVTSSQGNDIIITSSLTCTLNTSIKFRLCGINYIIITSLLLCNPQVE